MFTKENSLLFLLVVSDNKNKSDGKVVFKPYHCHEHGVFDDSLYLETPEYVLWKPEFEVDNEERD